MMLFVFLFFSLLSSFLVYSTDGTSSNSSWPQALAGTYGTFTCAQGYFASNTTVFCSQNGASASWGSDPCQPVYCANETSFNSSWPQTLAGTNGTFACTGGYYASNTSVNCTQNGDSATWGSNQCEPVYCSAGSSFNSSWPQTLAGDNATYCCVGGYFAIDPFVECTQDGDSASWGNNPCQPVYCAAGTSSNSSWPQTLAGTNGTFTCATG